MSISPESKMRSTDRKLYLRPKDGAAKSSTGLTDPRLFNGDNTLHLKMDPETCFWYFQYDKGILPDSLKDKFTGFKAAIKFAEEYYKKRNVEIVRVED